MTAHRRTRARHVGVQFGRGAEDRARRREELLDAALAAIRRLGPTASMDAMAAEAGITKPILYRHFGGRDGVIAAVAERFADELVRRLDEALSAVAAPPQQVRLAIDNYVRFIEEDPALYAFFAHYAPVGGAVVQRVVDRVAATLARPLGEELRRRKIDSAPAEAWAYGIVGMVHLAGAHWVSNRTVPRRRLIDYLTTLVLVGLEGGMATRE